MTWALVKKGEIVEVYENLPKFIKINGFTYDNQVFRNPEKKAELGIFDINYPQKPNGSRYRITDTSYVFNQETATVDAVYTTIELDTSNAKTALLAKVKPSYDAKLAEGFVYGENRYDVDDRSIMFIDIESRAAEIPEIAENWPAGYAWRTYDNSFVSMTAAELVSFSRAARLYRLAMQSKKWQHEVAIAALTTHAEIETYEIDWNLS